MSTGGKINEMFPEDILLMFTHRWYVQSSSEMLSPVSDCSKYKEPQPRNVEAGWDVSLEHSALDGMSLSNLFLQGPVNLKEE